MNPTRYSEKKAVPSENYFFYNMDMSKKTGRRKVETTVRCIPTQTAMVDGREFSTGGKPALCFRGKTYALGIINDEDMIHPITLTLREHDKAPLVMYGVEEYPVPKFITHMERIMQNKPISDEALALIRTWPNNPEDFGDEVIPDEPTVTRKPKKKKGPNIIATISSEIEIPSTKIRKFLRGQGMNAPYTDEKKIRKALKDYIP